MTEPRALTGSVVVAAAPEQLYDLVTDVTRTGEWSPSCRECWWAGDARAEVGSRFHGRNEDLGRSWETLSEVVVAERPTEFAWLVGEGFVRWGYTFERIEAGTRLTESWEFRPAGITMFHEKYGEKADRAISRRTQVAREGIPATLEAIKRIAEKAS